MFSKITHPGIAEETPKEALLELERRYKVLLNSAGDAIFIYDIEGRFLEVNQVACERLKYSREELLQMTLMDIDASESAALVPERLKEFLHQDRVFCETVHVRRDGTLIPVEMNNRMTEYAGRLAVLGIARDITKRKKAEAVKDQALARAVQATHALQEQTLALRQVHQELEKRVEERTVELSRANELLKEEIVERERAEAGQREALAAKEKALAKALRATRALQEQARELQESEQQFRSVVETSHSGILVVDDAFQIIYASDELCQLLKAAKEEIVGQDFRVFLDGESKELAVDRYVHRQRGEKVPSRYELNVVRSDGVTGYVELSATAIKDSAGNMKTVAQVLDITERKRVEAEREQLLVQTREQARQVQQIINTVPEGVLLLDADLCLCLANPAAQEYLAVLADAGIGDTLTHLGDQLLTELLTSPPPGLWHEITVDGPPCQVFEMIAQPMENGVETEGWVLVLRDVTQEQGIQQRIQQQERLAAVGQMAAGIAHDFNNIMATIVLCAQMSVRVDGLPPHIRERLVTINQQAQHATKLIQQILDFSRCTTLERCPTDLVVILKEQVELLERTLPENIRIDLVLDQGEDTTLGKAEALSLVVNTDPTRVQQVMMNLALNARDAMPEGGELRVELKRIRIENSKRAPLSGMKAGDWVQVRVSDSGTGIPSDALSHVFDPFFTTKARGQGTGLGLSQVYGIIKQHGGHVDVTTKVGEGTTFTLYLPAMQMSRLESLAQEKPDLVQGKGETILVVEDDITLRETIVKSLEELNYQTLAAANGREGLDVFEQHAREIALVLSDMVMPEMSGMALLYALRKKGHMKPVVMLTGHPLYDNALGHGDDLQSQSVAVWLRKPVDPEQLAEVIAQALSS